MTQSFLLHQNTLRELFGVINFASVTLSKGFLQSEVLGEVSVLEWGEGFREVCRELFREVFGLVLLGHSEQKKLQP